jgi:ABC-type multidrug transport system ATPase subunit
MQITLTNTGKRYNREWIFRHCDYTFLPGKSYAVTGPNGSGKSTFLQVIAGAIMQSEGSITYGDASTHSAASTLSYLNISIAAPYLELIEEMTSLEFLKFHTTFKSLTRPATDILREVGLEKAAHKQVRYFSSGMKQRLKLAQAFFSDTSVLLLDEPLTNLDTEGIALYERLIGQYTTNRLVIVSSNDRQEYDFCKEVISVSDFR